MRPRLAMPGKAGGRGAHRSLPQASRVRFRYTDGIRYLVILLLALAAAVPSTTRAGGPTMLPGAAEDSVRQPTLVGAKAQMDLQTVAGLNAVRLTQVWAPGETAPSAADTQILRNVAEAAHLDGVQVFLVVMNFGSRTTPLAAED